MRILTFIIALVLISGCKKATERGCFKSHGEHTVLEIPLDSTNKFILNKKIKFRIFEDSLSKLVIKGGENLVGLIEVNTENYETHISNLNKCHFLRDSDRGVEVEIHYPNLKRFRLETSDSVIFENTVFSDSLIIQFFESGSSMILDVDNKYTEVVVSRGTANFNLSGSSQNSIVKVQDNGFANAVNFRSAYLFAASSSTADLKVNFDSSQVNVFLDGSGDILYKGDPQSIVQTGVGSGKLIKY